MRSPSQIVDNVIRQGRVSNPEVHDDPEMGVRRMLEHIQSDPNVDATTIATVSDKGWDGFTYAIRL